MADTDKSDSNSPIRVVISMVYENDEFEYNTISNQVSHKPADVPKGDPIGYYGEIYFGDDKESPAVVLTTRSEILEYAKRNSTAYDEVTQSFHSGPWAEAFDYMAINRLLSKICFSYPFIKQKEKTRLELGRGDFAKILQSVISFRTLN